MASWLYKSLLSGKCNQAKRMWYGCDRMGAVEYQQKPCRGFATDEASDTEDSVSNGDSSEKSFRIPQFQGVYKAVILGEVMQPPTEVTLRSGRSIINLMVATGGMRVQRKMNDDPKGVKQIHKVVIYQDRFKDLAVHKIKKGQQVYLEGNMESRVFNDPVTGAVKLTREISVRQNGRIFLVSDLELKGMNNKIFPGSSKSKKVAEEEDSDAVVTE